MKKIMYSFFPITLLAALISCSNQGTGNGQTDQDHNLVEEQAEDEWELLLSDTTAVGWHNYLSNSIAGWKVEGGVLYTPGKQGDIVTDKIYSNFDLSLEWKIEEGGNSGVFYHVVEKPEYKRMYETGPEFQIIDNDNYPQELTEQQKTGSLSDVMAPTLAAAKKAGEWNLTRILVDGGHVEHWLNGKKILEYELGSDALKEKIAESKFATLDYAKVPQGRIGLQDHGGPVYFKNIKIKEL